MAASQANAPLLQKVAITSAIIAWSGLSVHGQVASIVIESGIRMGPYMVARLLHAILAMGITILLLGPAYNVTKLLSIPVTLNLAQTNSLSFWLVRMEQVGYQICVLLAILLTLSIAFHIARGLYSYISR
ncbi:hypothetical protein [Methylomusa anaerophila]|uniref:hypothetical protein n=1 Tax=Methylomusa anaerophila TaxID=1930071 RepID=UPI001E2A190F|nr:hypothetical protein [Methylomusa anaerophila]